MVRSVEIGDRSVGPGEPALLVAEAGFNHNGSLEIALDLIDAAAASGADAVKFQSFHPDELLHPSVDYRHLFNAAQLDEDAHAELAARAKEKNILFASTPFDENWVNTLDRLDAAFLKVASMDLTTPPLLEAIAATRRPVILSTGLATDEEVATGVEILETGGAGGVILLHCVSLYPTPLPRLNLRAIHTLADRFRLPVGFSDHTLGVEAPVWAVGAGACVIEKHFTVDKKLPGPDHTQSLDPKEFLEMVRRIRELEIALGNGVKAPCEEEQLLRNPTRRGIILRKALKKGETITREHLRCVRPIQSEGIPAAEFYSVCGKKSRSDLADGVMLRPGDIEGE
jgi:N-acetylneuraminate synthase/N,N'-diacetyllegionaminate synthase